MIERPDVDQLLAGELGQWLQTQTAVRDQARAKSNGRIVKSAMVIVAVAAILFLGPDFSGVFKMWIVTVMLMASGVWIYSPRAKAIQQTKEGINSALARALGLEYTAKIQPGAGFVRATTFQMVPRFDRSNFEDLWSGEIGGRKFALHEAELKQRRQSDKKTTYVTVFRGPVMTMSFDRRFQGITLVERAKKHKKFGFFGEKDKLEFGTIMLDKVDMVHPQFEDEFTIYSTDQVEARYLVHPTYVERLIALEDAFAGKKVRTLFMEGELTVILETRNMFETGGMNAARDREMIDTCIGQFMSMVDLADALNEPAR